MGHAEDVPKRQALKSAIVVVLVVATAIVAILGYLTLAIGLIALMIGLVSVAMLLSRRRIAQEIRSLTLENVKLAQAIEASQRHILAAVESEGLAAAERHHVAVTSLETGLASQRRLLAALESERLAGADRQRELLSGFEEAQGKLEETLGKIDESMGAVSRLDENFTSGQRRLDQNVTNLRWIQGRENEALLQLFDRFEPRAPMPASGGWALHPTGLLELLFLINRRRAQLVLELGSGTSSIWMGYALEKIGGRLISIDHDHEYAERTRLMLRLHGLDHVAEVRHAPLRPIRIAGETFDWYDLDAFKDVADVELLLVDGPPQSVGPMSRYPALHALEGKLAANAVVVLDDVNRPDERNIARRWTEGFTGLTRETAMFDRQAVFTYVRSPSSE